MHRFQTIPVFLVLFIGGVSAGAEAPVPGTRAESHRAAKSSLWDHGDRLLQRRLERELARLGLVTAADSGRLAVAVVDITTLDHPKVASINGDQMMYAASLPKLAILLGAFDKAQRQGAPFPAGLQADVERMIRNSSNPAATRVLEWVGREELLDLLQSPRLRLYDKTRNGGIWVGKDYAGGPAFHRDPLHNLSHGATAMQVARLLYMLESGELLNAEFSRAMKATLGDPGIRHKFVAGLATRPDARIYRKSGTWRDFHADGAIVESAGRRLIMVALANDPAGGDWLARLAVVLHDLVVKAPNDTRLSAAAINRGP
jgi:beta-lactamase class A